MQYSLRLDAGLLKLSKYPLYHICEEIKFAAVDVYKYFHPKHEKPNIGTIFDFLSLANTEPQIPDIENQNFKLTNIYDSNKNKFEVLQLTIDATENDSYIDITNKLLESLKEQIL